MKHTARIQHKVHWRINDQDARMRIVQAASEILEEVSDIDKITVRQIAERAEVGVGLINYHFGSKDNLLGTAIGDIMANRIGNFTAPRSLEIPPEERLKDMLKELCHVAAANRKLIRFVLTQTIMNGDMNAPLYLIPILKEIFEGKKEELELRILALQILHPLQVAAISPESFRLYSGIDLEEENSRNQYIDMLVEHVIPKAGR